MIKERLRLDGNEQYLGAWDLPMNSPNATVHSPRFIPGPAIGCESELSIHIIICDDNNRYIAIEKQIIIPSILSPTHRDTLCAQCACWTLIVRVLILYCMPFFSRNAILLIAERIVRINEYATCIRQVVQLNTVVEHFVPNSQKNFFYFLCWNSPSTYPWIDIRNSLPIDGRKNFHSPSFY